jgi:hypothetical protein
MSQLRDQQQTLRIGSEGKDFVDIQLESSIPVTIRLQLDGGCKCHHDNGNRPGSYVESDRGPR